MLKIGVTLYQGEDEIGTARIPAEEFFLLSEYEKKQILLKLAIELGKALLESKEPT